MVTLENHQQVAILFVFKGKHHYHHYILKIIMELIMEIMVRMVLVFNKR